jgi:N-acetylneuraminic acid mutarotase
MKENRGGHTATRLENGEVLVAGGGGELGMPVGSAELYNPSRGRWTAVGSMNTARAGHTATLLPDGSVLVVGGAIDPDGQAVLASAELYDPATGSWTDTGNLATARQGHTATPLPDGKVLVTGGIGPFVGPTDSVALASTELYDPLSGRWTTVAGLGDARFGHTSTLLTDGSVLVAGGTAGFGILLTSAEVYDSSSGSWTATGGMIEARHGHKAVLLADGNVLVAGGSDGNGQLDAAELYDLTGTSWTVIENMLSPREYHTVTLLSDGDVLVVGGSSGGDMPASAELYDSDGGS